jgi:hypothetical protein
VIPVGPVCPVGPVGPVSPVCPVGPVAETTTEPYLSLVNESEFAFVSYENAAVAVGSFGSTKCIEFGEIKRE